MGTSPRIYVLDDDEVFGRLLASILKKFGFECELFRSSEALKLKMCVAQPYLCFVDLNVESTASSLELLRLIRSAFSPAIRLIVVSSSSDRTAVADAIEAGANDYLLKPLERSVLVPKLRNYLDSPELKAAETSPALAAELEFPGSLNLDAELLTVDEMGIKMRTSYLISKGTVLTVDGAILGEIVKREKPLLLTTVSTWVDVERGGFGAYLEFDATDSELLSNVRNWIAAKIDHAA